jgi:AcrR family transcriptional regulator
MTEIPGLVPFQPPPDPDDGVRLANPAGPGGYHSRGMASPPVPRAQASASRSAEQAGPRRTAATAVTAPAPGPSLRAVDGAVGVPASKRVLRSQGRRTMRRLLDAAMIAFDERGYYDTRINDVVKIAKTSHGTFYLYFSNKEDLLRALVAEAAGEAQVLYDALSTLPAEGGAPQWEDVHRWIRAYSELWTRYAPLFRAWTDLATIDPELVDLIRSTFTTMSSALAQQIGPDSSGHIIDPDAAGLATLAMLDRFHYLREFVGQPIDDVALETMTTMVYRALFDPNA